MYRLDLKKGALLCFSGFLSSNVYLIVLDNQAVAVDAGMPWTANRVLDYLNENSLKLECIFLTHGHFDHIMGAGKLKKETNARVLAYPKSERGDVTLKDGDLIRVLDNKLSFAVTYTGVHRADHVWFFEKNNRLLFVGDEIVAPTAFKMIAETQDSNPRIILPGHGKPYAFRASNSM